MLNCAAGCSYVGWVVLLEFGLLATVLPRAPALLVLVAVIIQLVDPLQPRLASAPTGA